MILPAHCTAAATRDSVRGLGGVEQVLGRLEMRRHQDSSHNREHSLATFFHDDSLTCLLFIRLINLGCRGQSTRLGCSIISKEGSPKGEDVSALVSIEVLA